MKTVAKKNARYFNFPFHSIILTNRYRQDARPCVHQAAHAALHLSSTARAVPPAPESSRLLSLVPTSALCCDFWSSFHPTSILDITAADFFSSGLVSVELGIRLREIGCPRRESEKVIVRCHSHPGRRRACSDLFSFCCWPSLAMAMVKGWRRTFARRRRWRCSALRLILLIFPGSLFLSFLLIPG